MDEILRINEKISEYKIKIQSEEKKDKTLALYVEPLGKYLEGDDNPESGPFEPTFEVQYQLLNPDSKRKVILLTRGIGSGKTSFCKHLTEDLPIQASRN